MTEQEQRIAIAEACGWSDIVQEVHPTITYLWGWIAGAKDMIPDYPDDLNAMHEVEKTLDDDQMLDYVRILAEDIGHRFGIHNSRIAVCTAPAAQRAEAFLRTINKWKD